MAAILHQVLCKYEYIYEMLHYNYSEQGCFLTLSSNLMLFITDPALFPIWLSMDQPCQTQRMDFQTTSTKGAKPLAIHTNSIQMEA